MRQSGIHRFVKQLAPWFVKTEKNIIEMCEFIIIEYDW